MIIWWSLEENLIFQFFWKKQLRCAWVQNEFTWKLFDESIIKGHASKIAIPAIWFSYNYKNGPTGQFYRFCHIKFEYSRSMCVDKILFFFQNILELSYTAQKTTFATTSKLFFKKKFLTLHPSAQLVGILVGWSWFNTTSVEFSSASTTLSPRAAAARSVVEEYQRSLWALKYPIIRMSSDGLKIVSKSGW